MADDDLDEMAKAARDARESDAYWHRQDARARPKPDPVTSWWIRVFPIIAGLIGLIASAKWGSRWLFGE